MTLKPEDKFVTLNGLRFHYLDWGNEAKPALVLLHGFTSHAHSWDTFARSVAERYHVVALDQRGHGETEWTDDYAAERRVEDLDVFVKALGFSKFHLLGLSMGGICAYGYTALQPETVEKLVIVDIGPELMSQGTKRIGTGVLQKDIFESEEEAYKFARAGNALADDKELRHRIQYSIKQTDDGKWTYRYDKLLRSPARPLPRQDAEKAWAMLRQITCPTLLVRGEKTDLLSEEVAGRMTREIKNCRLVNVPDAGHSVPLDNPQGFIAAVTNFL
jgi:esterase